MGCGASTPDGSNASLSQEKERIKSDSNNLKEKINGQTETSVQNSDIKETTKPNGLKEIPPKPTKLLSKRGTVPKPVSFDVGLDFTASGKRPSKRLKQLEPITAVPKLTAEMLEEKMKLADEKRAAKLENIRETSRKSTKLRSRIADAQQFAMERQNTMHNELTEKLRSADSKKEMKRREMEEKKRLREERAKRVREKAKEMRGEADLEFEVEKDENFNDDEEESWLSDGTHTRESSGIGERIYSGRESPAKQVRPISSAQERARNITSASTTDSFDYAFQRNPKKISYNSKENDDFFDS